MRNIPSLKCILVSLVPLSQLGCAPARHDDQATADTGGWQVRTTAHTFVEQPEEFTGSGLPEEQTTKWRLRITCDPSNLRVEVEAATEHIAPAMLRSELGRKAAVMHRFGNDRPVSSLWQMSSRKGTVFLEAGEATRFLSEMLRSSRLMLRVGYGHREFVIGEGGKVLHAMLGACTVMETSASLESLPAS